MPLCIDFGCYGPSCTAWCPTFIIEKACSVDSRGRSIAPDQCDQAGSSHSHGMRISRFRLEDRSDAGRQLAARLLPMALERPVVYALPRGGVPVALEIARALRAPLDLILVRKIGAPGAPEVALGAVVDGEHPQTVINEEVRRRSGADDVFLDRARARELRRSSGAGPSISATAREWIPPAGPRFGRRRLRDRRDHEGGAGGDEAAGAAKVCVAVPVAPEEPYGSSASRPTSWCAFTLRAFLRRGASTTTSTSSPMRDDRSAAPGVGRGDRRARARRPRPGVRLQSRRSA